MPGRGVAPVQSSGAPPSAAITVLRSLRGSRCDALRPRTQQGPRPRCGLATCQASGRQVLASTAWEAVKWHARPRRARPVSGAMHNGLAGVPGVCSGFAAGRRHPRRQPVPSPATWRVAPRAGVAPKKSPPTGPWNVDSGRRSATRVGQRLRGSIDRGDSRSANSLGRRPAPLPGAQRAREHRRGAGRGGAFTARARVSPPIDHFCQRRCTRASVATLSNVAGRAGEASTVCRLCAPRPQRPLSARPR